MRRRTKLVIVGLLLSAAAAATLLHQASRARCLALAGEAVCRVETDQPLVALTFDDGPTAAGLDAVLPQLERHGATATFFLIGAEAEREPALVARIAAAGHELGNHSYSHQRMVGRSAGFYDAELQKTQQALSRAGPAPTSFRPPYGKKLWGLPLAVRRAGLQLVMWDVEDPQTSDPAAFAEQVVRHARPGSIILLHAMYPANDAARAALPSILAGLRARGLKVVSVGELQRAASRPSP